MSSQRKFYGVSKGSKRFPYPETFKDPDAITFDQAQVEYDFLAARRTKLVRAIARDIRELDIKHEEDLTDDLLSCREQVRNIDKRLGFLADQFPEVVR